MRDQYIDPQTKSSLGNIIKLILAAGTGWLLSFLGLN